jgi:demethylmenaquinone methyltransferase/2-methoxy-6-polyprenyl-1,4-benzoquinol methylase
MANVFFEPGERRAAKVRELFARIAPHYDLLNDVMSLGLHRSWKERVVTLACPMPGQTALDLCCGTGDLAFRLTHRGLRVAGLDFSDRMLGLAQRRRVRERPKSEVSSPKEADITPGGSRSNLERSLDSSPCFLQGDAEQLPFRDESFDIVTVGYGLRNLASWETGLCEMRRVAKTGGRVLVLDFGKPDNPTWRRLYFGYLRLVVPWLGRLFCGSATAYGYILESLQYYPAQHAVAAKMRQSGFDQVRIVNLLGGLMTINYGVKR